MAGVVFFGSPDFAVASLEALVASSFRPVLVVTQPDRPSGRGRRVRPTPVRVAAERYGLPVMVMESFRDERTVARLVSCEPDYLAVTAFGLILPARVLEIPRRGSINVHASLLPAHRGASPINAALVAGDLFTGVTTMEMTAECDAGPVYLQRIVPVDPMENAGSLGERLAPLGGELLVETLERIAGEGLKPHAQPGEGASLAPRLHKSDGVIPWERDAIDVHNHVRGMNPWPGSFSFLGGGHLKVLAAEPSDMVDHGARPGEVLAVGPEGIVVACGLGSVRLLRLQAEGKRPLDARDYLRGTRLAVGTLLGSGGSDGTR